MEQIIIFAINMNHIEPALIEDSGATGRQYCRLRYFISQQWNKNHRQNSPKSRIGHMSDQVAARQNSEANTTSAQEAAKPHIE